jgi:hypothetical protein
LISFQLARVIGRPPRQCAFCDASRQRLACSVDLVPVVHPLLAEHRQQHDAPPGREVGGDSERSPVAIEAKLEWTFVQRSGDRHTERRTPRREAVEVERHRAELLRWELVEPTFDLRLQLDAQ